MSSPRLLTNLVASGAVCVLVGVPADKQLAAPTPVGWTEVGHIVVDSAGCATCPATFPTESRPMAFALASDSPFPINLAGRFDVRCADGSKYNELLSSPSRMGIFQLVRNLCMNYESTSVTVSITTVTLSPPDANRRAGLTIYGTN